MRDMGVYNSPAIWGPIYKISYDNLMIILQLTIILKLWSTYDGRLIYKTSYEERKASLR